MNKEFVPYELAVKLKQLGFDKPCFFAFDNCSHPMRCSDLRTNEQKFDGVNYNSSSYTSQPTFSQAFRWFRKKHRLDSFCRQTTLDGRSYFKISKIETDEIIKGYSNFTTTYEAAELAALDKLIEIIETKQLES